MSLFQTHFRPKHPKAVPCFFWEKYSDKKYWKGVIKCLQLIQQDYKVI